MIKLIASDIDGTLVPESVCTINPRFYEVIRELKKQGRIFVAASGRQYRSMRCLFEPVIDDIIFIAGNGTNVIYRNQKLESVSMNRENMEAAVRYMRGLSDCIFTVSTSDCIYGEVYDEDFERLLVEGYHNQFRVVEDLLKEPIEIQKMAIYRRDGVEELLKEVTDAWSDKFRVFQSGKCWIDIVDYGADKGSALKKIQKSFGILPEETMVFGDNYNDIGMFEAAKESYAVLSAQEGVKKAAAHIAGSVEEEGVLKVLEELLTEGAPFADTAGERQAQ